MNAIACLKSSKKFIYKIHIKSQFKHTNQSNRHKSSMSPLNKSQVLLINEIVRECLTDNYQRYKKVYFLS